MKLEAVRTEFSADDVQDALIRAWIERFGSEPDERVLALLMTLSDFETSTWHKSFHNNLGNIVISDDSQDYFKLKDPKTGLETIHRYRVYDDLDDGARGLVRQLTSETRPAWKEGLLSGDPEFFVDQLGQQPLAYYEADPELYLQRFLSRYQRYAPADSRQPVFDDSDEPEVHIIHTGASPAAALLTVAFAGGLGLLAYRLLNRRK